MNKNDLQDGMIVKLKDGEVYVVLNYTLHNFDGYLSLSSYNDSMKHHHYSKFDIVEIRKPDGVVYIKNLKYNFEKCTVLWKIKLNYNEVLEFAKSLKKGELVVVSNHETDLQANGFVRVFDHYTELDGDTLYFYTKSTATGLISWKYCEKYGVI